MFNHAHLRQFCSNMDLYVPFHFKYLTIFLMTQNLGKKQQISLYLFVSSRLDELKTFYTN